MIQHTCFEAGHKEQEEPSYTESVMRLFIGIPLAESVVAGLTAVCNRLRSKEDALRWSAPESWHITLQFLGSATPEQFDCLTNHLARVRSVPVSLRLDGLGIFDRAGVFLAKVEMTPELTVLQNRVTVATAHCGFVPEDRPYQPHITLARSKGDRGRQQLKTLKNRIPAKLDFSGFAAHEFLLYESHLGPGGSKYEVRQRFSLSGQPPTAPDPPDL